MRFTTQQLIKQGFRKLHDGSWGKPSNLIPTTKKVDALATPLLGAKPESDAQHPLPQAHSDEKGRSYRVTVCITSRRQRLLDPDNNAGATKYLLDQLRYQGIIPDDDPQTIDLITRQEKVKDIEETGTLLEITFHDQKPQPQTTT